MKKIKKTPLLLFLLFFLVPAVFAHTPLKPGGENNSLETALEIPKPTKSWTLYREFHHVGEAEYFKLHLHEGEKFVVSVYTPRNAEPDFIPNLVVAGPNIEIQYPSPRIIEVPEDAEATLIKGGRPAAPEYEPFTPASYYFTADYSQDVTVEGDYYFIVYSDNGEGKYGVAVGYIETFTLSEWLMIPFDVINIHQWEGQSLTLIVTPMAVTLVLGIFLLFWKFKPAVSVAVFLGVLAGFLYIGSGFMMITQMFIALLGATSTSSLILTVVFSTLPVVLGLVVLRKIVNLEVSWKMKDRVIFAVLGVLGFVLWAGLLVGPSLAIVVSILPAFLFT